VLDIFAAYLHEQTSRIAPSPEDRALVKTILGELLAGQVDKVDFFKGVVAKQPIPAGYYGAKPSTGSPDIALAFIKKCVAYGNPAVAAAALEHMLDCRALPADIYYLRTEQVLLPLAPLLCNDPSARAAIPHELMSKLGQTVVQQMISAIQTKSGQISRKDLGLMLDTATQTGNAELITESYVRITLLVLLDSHDTWTGSCRNSRLFHGMRTDGRRSSERCTTGRTRPRSQSEPAMRSGPR
jgi:hypothetical protein